MSDEFNEDIRHQDISSSDVRPWRKIFKMIFGLRHLRISATLMIIFIFFQTLSDIALPIVNMFVINVFFEQQITYTHYLVYFIIAYLFLCLIMAISTYGFLYFGCKLEAQLAYELRKEAYENLQKLSFSYFDNTPQGWILARMTNDTQRLSTIISWGIVDVLFALSIMTFIFIVLLVINPILTLILVPLIIILFLAVFKIRKKMLLAFRESKRINSEITASFSEEIMGSTTAKTLVLEENRRLEFSEKTNKFKKVSLKAVIFSALLTPIVFLLSYIGVAATLVAGISIGTGVILISQLYIFIDYTVRFFEPAASLSRVLGEFQQAQASAERVVSLIEQKPTLFDTPEVIKKYGTIFEPKYENFEKLAGKIQFKDVSFWYKEDEIILKDFNLTVNKGQTVALVGHTGSGKSTIVNLICRFYEPRKGQILIDDIDYKKRSITWLHSNLGYVLQSPKLFSGTILENIRYGNLKATDAEVINASKIVNAHDFIVKLELGYKTVIDEDANKLSLGQKQLISIARAIVANPKILIFDEATSSIDIKTESIIQEAVNKVLEGKTSFIIAHRLSTIVSADLILVLENGQIVESGNHIELLNMKGKYFELYKNQFLKEYQNMIIK